VKPSGRTEVAAQGKADRKPAFEPPLLTLAIDIGGSHIKASVLNPAGGMMVAPARVDTPHPATPKAVIEAISGLAAPLPPYQRVSVGFPGVVCEGRILTAPNLGTADWQGYLLAQALSARLRRPTRVLNDADVQGLGVITGRGLECVLTLGTGIGSALFKNGRLLPHLELGQHPVCNNKTYDQYLGADALRRKGVETWNRRLRKALDIVHTLVNYDLLHLGGGNAKEIDFQLPGNAKLAANIGGITGGIRLWDPLHDEHFPG
jgi:polyphosphate glucokinase